jgi:hypothetical protein
MDLEREEGRAHPEADELIRYFREMGLTVTGDPGKRGLGTWRLKLLNNQILAGVDTIGGGPRQFIELQRESAPMCNINVGDYSNL